MMAITCPYHHRLTIHKKRCCVVTKIKSLDQACCAYISKTLANTLTYPLESIRLMTLKEGKTKAVQLNKLYTGFPTYIPYNIVSNIATYKIFFTIASTVCCKNLHINTLIAAFLTSFITATYKVPYGYYLKNQILDVNINRQTFVTFLTNKAFPKAILACVTEDVHDLYIRFILNQMVQVHFPHVNSLTLSFITAVLSSFVICPIEFWKTSILCRTVHLTLSVRTVLMRVCISILNLFIFYTSSNFLYQFI